MTSNSKKGDSTKGTHATAKGKKKGGNRNSDHERKARNDSVIYPSHRSCLGAVAVSILCALIAVLHEKFGTVSSTPRSTNIKKRTEGGNQSIKSANKQFVTHTTVQNRPRATLSDLFRIACSETQLVYCNDYLWEIQNRTVYSREALQEGWKLLEIPRGVQIWTLDALRDPFIQRELLYRSPRHARTKQLLQPRAYLTAYLVFLSKERASQRKPKLPLERLQKAYLDYLPRYEEFATFHPIVHMDTTMTSNNKNRNTSSVHYYHRHGAFSSYLIARTYQEVMSEYEAFCEVSPDVFAHSVSWQEYLTARLQIQSRSFQAVPTVTHELVSDQELERYRPHVKASSSSSSLSLRESSLASAVVPLLDSLDHHTQPNVGWKYVGSSSGTGTSSGSSSVATSHTGSFLVFAQQSVGPGSELKYSYGVNTADSWLLAGYGFVNGEGSGRRAVLLASFHTMHYSYLEPEAEYAAAQEQELQKHYLSFDDGYKTCMGGGDDDAKTTPTTPPEIRELKRLKLAVLKGIANLQPSWTATVPPPPPPPPHDSTKTLTTTTTAAPPLVDGGIADIVSTCRLLALTHRDFGGHATHMLQILLDRAAVADSSSDDSATPPRIKRDSDALEFRAMHWLDRLAREGRRRMLLLEPTTMEEDGSTTTTGSSAAATTSVVDDLEMQLRGLVEDASLDRRQSVEWVASYGRLGEVEALATLSRYARQQKREIAMGRDFNKDDEGFIVRAERCEDRKGTNRAPLHVLQ